MQTKAKRETQQKVIFFSAKMGCIVGSRGLVQLGGSCTGLGTVGPPKDHLSILSE